MAGTQSPSSRNAAESCKALGDSPTKMGMIWLALGPVSQPCSCKFRRNSSDACNALRRRCGSAATMSSAAMAAALPAGGPAVEKTYVLARFTSQSTSPRLPQTNPPEHPKALLNVPMRT